MQEKYPVGELHLLGVEGDERRAIVSILRNEEERARLKNPLERIMRLQQAKGDWKIETTTKRRRKDWGAASRKQEAARSPTGGAYNKFVRVVWQKSAE
jgi:hypothetical protein